MSYPGDLRLHVGDDDFTARFGFVFVTYQSRPLQEVDGGRHCEAVASGHFDDSSLFHLDLEGHDVEEKTPAEILSASSVSRLVSRAASITADALPEEVLEVKSKITLFGKERICCCNVYSFSGTCTWSVLKHKPCVHLRYCISQLYQDDLSRLLYQESTLARAICRYLKTSLPQLPPVALERAQRRVQESTRATSDLQVCCTSCFCYAVIPWGVCTQSNLCCAAQGIAAFNESSVACSLTAS